MVDSTRCESADLLLAMATMATQVRKWMTRVPAAFVGLNIPRERASPSGIVISRAERCAPVSLCYYSDAEYQVLLCELHYPRVGRRLR
jgi:hypothetical protein